MQIMCKAIALEAERMALWFKSTCSYYRDSGSQHISQQIVLAPNHLGVQLQKIQCPSLASVGTRCAHGTHIGMQAKH